MKVGNILKKKELNACWSTPQADSANVIAGTGTDIFDNNSQSNICPIPFRGRKTS